MGVGARNWLRRAAFVAAMMIVPSFSGSLPPITSAAGDGTAEAGEALAMAAVTRIDLPDVTERSFDLASIVLAHECAKISFTC